MKTQNSPKAEPAFVIVQPQPPTLNRQSLHSWNPSVFIDVFAQSADHSKQSIWPCSRRRGLWRHRSFKSDVLGDRSLPKSASVYETVSHSVRERVVIDSFP
jgi:hypothetical protein